MTGCILQALHYLKFISVKLNMIPIYHIIKAYFFRTIMISDVFNNYMFTWNTKHGLRKFNISSVRKFDNSLKTINLSIK